jgi:hypothetical protein
VFLTKIQHLQSMNRTKLREAFLRAGALDRVGERPRDGGESRGSRAPSARRDRDAPRTKRRMLRIARVCRSSLRESRTRADCGSRAGRIDRE